MALGRSLLGKVFEQKWWSYLCSQACQHSWETRSLQEVFGYEVLWHRISSGHRWQPEESKEFLNSIEKIAQFDEAAFDDYAKQLNSGTFSLNDKYLKRSGLDYWDKLEIEHIIDFEEFENMFAKNNAPAESYSRFHFFTTKIQRKRIFNSLLH